MKPELKRIEAALQHVSDQRFAPAQSRNAIAELPHNQAASFASAPSAARQSPAIAAQSAASFAVPRSQSSADPLPNQADSLEQALTSLPAPPPPDLPHFVNPIVPGEGSRRAFGHPALAMNLLNNLQTTVKSWATALQDTIQQIEAIYAEGPIVDGWLESYPDAPVDSPEQGYRLCGLNEDGQIWCRPCPPDQVADVSWAIARCQRLHNLLGQKHSLEAKLCRLTDSLIALHGETIH